MKNIKYILSFITIALASISVSADGHEEPGTIAEIAATEGFTALVAALDKAGLVEALNGKRQFTVFAPTDEAFNAAAVAVLGAGSTAADLLAALDVETLTTILLYHVAPGERYSDDVLLADRIRTMAKDFVYVDGLTIMGNNSSAGLIVPFVDIEASNGVIHVIDFVLLP